MVGRVFYFLLVLFLGSFSLCAQKTSENHNNPGKLGFADKKFYLVDSLRLENIAGNDKVLLDSALQHFHSSNADTLKLKWIEFIAEECMDEDVWPMYNKVMYQFADSILRILPKRDLTPEQVVHRNRVLGYKAGAINNYGYIYHGIGEIDLALSCYEQSIQIQKKINQKDGLATSYNNIGLIYSTQGNVEKALDYFEMSLSIQELINDKEGIATCLNNIGSIYDSQKDTIRALENYKKAYDLQKEIGDIEGMATSLNNIGVMHSSLEDSSVALQHYRMAMALNEEIGYKSGITTNLGNIGSIYEDMGNLVKARKYYLQALDLQKTLGDKDGISTSLISIGNLDYEQGKYDEALSAAQESLKLSKELGFPDNIKGAAQLLYKIYKKQNKYQQGWEMYELFVQMRDSVSNQSTQKTTLTLSLQHEYEKEKLLVQKEQEKKDALAKEEKEMQRWIVYSISAILLLVLGLVVVVYSRLKITRRQKEIILRQKLVVDEAMDELNQINEEILAQRDQIELQKNEAEQQHLHITESIQYAKRIQTALLKSEEHENPNIPPHFVFFRPKDIVSGDFYWALEKQGHLYLAAVDCTGHGVPGALLTMLGTSFLNEINSTPELYTPSVILDLLRDKIVKELSQSSVEGGSKDGMDISLIRLNYETLELQWAGANNPLYLVANDEEEPEHRDVLTKPAMKILKGNRQPISYAEVRIPFTNHTIQLQKKDTIYLFTDGYPDQFGGTQNRKFGYKKFRQLLMSINHEPMDVQKKILSDTYENWKKAGQEDQLDDICVIGLCV